MNAKDCINQLTGLKEHCCSMIDKEDPESIWKCDEEALQFAIDLLSGKGEKLFELLKLMQENPDLPIVPMVDSEIVADDGYNRWMGSWGASCVEEYLIGEERIYFRDDDDIEEAVTGVLGWDAYEAMSDEEAEAAYRALPWVKAIIVNIDLPD